MNPQIQTLLTVSIPTIAVLIGILVNNSRLNDMNNRFGDVNTRLNDMNGRLSDMNNRLNDLRTHVDQRIDDLRDTLLTEIRRVEQVFEARVSNLEARIH